MPSVLRPSVLRPSRVVMLVGVAGEHTAQPKILRSTLGFLRLHNECSEMTSTQNLLSHLAWLKDNLPQTPDAVFAVYHAALRLRAETLKDRVPDAILPKTTRRQLNTRVNTLVARSRRAARSMPRTKRARNGLASRRMSTSRSANTLALSRVSLAATGSSMAPQSSGRPHHSRSRFRNSWQS